MQAPLPRDEAERLEALRRYEILDTAPEEAFDRLARLAADILDVPVALVSLADARRHWFKARLGLDATEIPRGVGFCGHAILGDEVMVVEDAGRDPRFAADPLVAGGPRFRFYAGAPIRVRGGHRVGAVCALDTAPRTLPPARRRALAGLAAQAADQLELRLAGRELRRREAMLAQAGRMARVGAWALDLATMTTDWSDEVYRIHELEPGERHALEGALAFYPPEARAVLEPALALAIAEGTPFDLELPLVTAKGGRRWVRAIGEAEREGEGDRIVRVFGTFQDVTGPRRAEQALKDEEARLRAVVDTAVDGIVLIDAAGTIRRANPATERMFGYDPGELAGRDIRVLMPAPLAAAHDRAFGRRLAAGGRIAVEAGRGAVALRKDGSTFPVELAAGEIAQAGERLFVGFVRDVTGRERAEAALRESEGRFRSIGDSVPVIVWVVDPGGACTYVNRRWYEYTGQAAGEGEGDGDGWLRHVHPDDVAAARGLMDAAMARREPFRIEYRLRRRDGAWRWMLDAGAPRHDASGAFQGYVGSIVDIDERRRAEASVRHLAHHDPLTGLPNRALFQDRLQQALAEARRHGEQVALLLLDLDRFKDVNDSLGHDAGDALLRAVAARLRACVRESDTVARLGGDEFAVVLPRLAGPAAAAEVAGKIATALAEPVAHADAPVHTAASVGVTVFPGDGGQAGQLLKNADIALYRAKAEGGGGYCFFVADMRAQVERRRGTEDELRLALARGEVVPFFQPKVRLADGRLVGFEALARWRHPERGLVPPAEFLAVAEETGLIARLDEAVLRQAVAQARAWRGERLAAGCVAVNVAGAQLRRGGLAATVGEVLAAAGLSPRRLVVEVTEGAFLGRGADRVAEELGALHALGVTVALDDFGTGHASLTHLKRFPVGMLKVDASFVRDMLLDPNDAAIVRAVVNLGHSLGMRVVAEGVETTEQADWLRLQGCDYGQGFLFGRPMPAEAATAWLRRGRRAAPADPGDLRPAARPAAALDWSAGRP